MEPPIAALQWKSGIAIQFPFCGGVAVLPSLLFLMRVPTLRAPMLRLGDAMEEIS
jgi:hypothetical protein